MDKIILDLYSNGDLYMMFAKIMAYMIALLVMTCVVGAIRGFDYDNPDNNIDMLCVLCIPCSSVRGNSFLSGRCQ